MIHPKCWHFLDLFRSSLSLFGVNILIINLYGTTLFKKIRKEGNYQMYMRPKRGFLEQMYNGIEEEITAVEWGKSALCTKLDCLFEPFLQ